MAFEVPFGSSPETPANTHDLGDLCRVTAEFTNVVTEAALDPTVVKLSFKDPSDNVTTWIYGTDAEIVKDSTGNYHADIDCDEAGTWYYRWWSTGTGQAADEASFIVSDHEAV
jgi:hypothetical protein